MRRNNEKNWKYLEEFDIIRFNRNVVKEGI